VTDWPEAACRQYDPDLWFANEGSSQGRRDVAEAKRICNTCPVLNMCARYALENDEEWGIWGTITEADRRKMRLRTA
jgi:WhiB family redox-sensing transcriptional regulator